MNKITDCPDCGVKPGKIHKDNCDVEKCSVCAGQQLQCSCKGHDKKFSRWTGIYPGEAEAKFLDIDLNKFFAEGYAKIFFVKPK